MNKILLFVSTFFIALICNAQENEKIDNTEADATPTASQYYEVNSLTGKLDTVYTKEGLRLPIFGYTKNDTTREVNYLAIGKQCEQNGKAVYKTKSKSLQYEEIFSIKRANGTIEQFYIPDTTNNEVMSIQEFRSFLDGVYTAKQQYKAKGALWAGVGVGVASVIATPFMGLNFLYTPLIPAAYTGAVTFTDPDVAKIIARNPEKYKDINFMQGYQEEAKRRRIVNTIIGGCTGMFSALIVAYTYDSMVVKK